MEGAIKLLDFLKVTDWPKSWKNEGHVSDAMRKNCIESTKRLLSDILVRMKTGANVFAPEDMHVMGYAANGKLTVQLYSDASEQHDSPDNLWNSGACKLVIPIGANKAETSNAALFVGSENVCVGEDLMESLNYFNSEKIFQIPKEGTANKIPVSQVIDMEPTAELVLSLWRKVDKTEQEKFLDVGRWMFNRMSSLLKYAAGPNSSNRFDQNKTYMMFHVNDWYGEYVPGIWIMDMKTDMPLFAIIPYRLYDAVNPLQTDVYSSENCFSAPVVTGRWQEVRAYFGRKSSKCPRGKIMRRPDAFSDDEPDNGSAPETPRRHGDVLKRVPRKRRAARGA